MSWNLNPNFSSPSTCSPQPQLYPSTCDPCSPRLSHSQMPFAILSPIAHVGLCDHYHLYFLTTAQQFAPAVHHLRCFVQTLFVFVGVAFGDASNFLITACLPQQNCKSPAQDRLLLKRRVPIISIYLFHHLVDPLCFCVTVQLSVALFI
jgi:hypothetical protein